ncbi:MAG TPA: hypothetical protein VNU46_08050 [Gemmatimonadaceae bacterium]|nr:hypothetical protein [Gemmatimonadaceae bacterium]
MAGFRRRTVAGVNASESVGLGAQQDNSLAASICAPVPLSFYYWDHRTFRRFYEEERTNSRFLAHQAHEGDDQGFDAEEGASASGSPPFEQASGDFGEIRAAWPVTGTGVFRTA